MTTRAELLQDLDAWLARDDVAADADASTMLRLAEAQINRRVRVRAQETTIKLECRSRATPLPDDFLAFRAATLDSSLGRDIQYLTPERIREAPIWNNQGGGLTDNTALAMTIEGNALILAPAPTDGGPVTLDLVYFARFLPLVNGDDSNWLLMNAYDVYLFAALKQVSIWDQDDQAALKFELLLDRALEELRISERRGRFPGGKALVSTGNPRGVV